MSSMVKNSFEEAEVVDPEDTVEVVVEAEYGKRTPIQLMSQERSLSVSSVNHQTTGPEIVLVSRPMNSSMRTTMKRKYI